MPSTSSPSPRSPVTTKVEAAQVTPPTVNKSPLPTLPRDLNEAILHHQGLKPVKRGSLSNEMNDYLAQRRIAVAGLTLSDNISYTGLASDNDEA